MTESEKRERNRSGEKCERGQDGLGSIERLASPFPRMKKVCRRYRPGRSGDAERDGRCVYDVSKKR